MSRSLWKGPFIDNYLIRSNILNKESDTESRESTSSISIYPFHRKIKVWSRRSLIIPEFLNQNFEVHNGKQFVSLQITEEMIGHKFGEFASTRKRALHKKKLKK